MATQSGKAVAAKKPARKRTARGGKFANEADSALVHGIADHDGFAIVTQPELHRREAFAQAYVSTGKGSEAARKAGYEGTPASIAKTAHRLLAEPGVRARIRKIQDDWIKKLQADQVTVLAELARIAFNDPRDAFDAETGEPLPMNKIPEDCARAITGYKVVEKTFGEDGSSVEKEIKFGNKGEALDKLGKHLGLWKGEEEGGKFTAEAFLEAMLAARERVMTERTQRGNQGTMGYVDGHLQVHHVPER